MKHKSSPYILFLSLLFLFIADTQSFADVLYFKTGQKIEGLIKKEDDQAVDLEICLGGVVQFKKEEIERIERLPSEDAKAVRDKWLKERKEEEKTRAAITQKQDSAQSKPSAGSEKRDVKNISFTEKSHSIVLSVTLNKRVPATLVLDTGASFVILRKSMAERLGVNLKDIKLEATLILADGRKVNAKYVELESVKLGDVEATNVESAIMMEDVSNTSIGDGLLGMSFLRKFNFTIDHKNNKIAFEKIP